MNVANNLGFGPKYEYAQVPGTDVVALRVTPGKLAGKLPPAEIALTSEEFERFKQWLAGTMLIQDAFPDWSGEDREVLLTGIMPADWKRIFPAKGG